MKTVWTSGKDKGEADNIEASYKSCGVMRERLVELCEKEIKGSYQLTQSQYDCPNWQMKQADSIGYRRALEKIISLIS